MPFHHSSNIGIIPIVSLKRIDLLFENEYCLVLNKPAGLAVQGGEGVGASLDALLADEYSPRPLLVHRLDKDTSGVILVAKNHEAAARFSALFGGGPGTAGRGVLKQYMALCAGIPQPPEGLIREDLEVRGVVKKSETRYRVLGSRPLAGVSAPDCAALELELGTGRMHQIRRHLAHTGHPILGDDKYGDFALNKALRKATGLKRLLLHASRLVIDPAGFPGGIDITAPLPDHFSPFWPGIDSGLSFSHDGTLYE
jgi:23S rRNA pseudouridine955/2504/2580 synthase